MIGAAWFRRVRYYQVFVYICLTNPRNNKVIYEQLRHIPTVGRFALRPVKSRYDHLQSGLWSFDKSVTNVQACIRPVAPSLAALSSDLIILNLQRYTCKQVMIILYQLLVRDSGLANRDIAGILNRDNRTIWTSYKRALEKLNE